MFFFTKTFTKVNKNAILKLNSISDVKNIIKNLK